MCKFSSSLNNGPLSEGLGPKLFSTVPIASSKLCRLVSLNLVIFLLHVQPGTQLGLHLGSIVIRVFLHCCHVCRFLSFFLQNISRPHICLEFQGKSVLCTKWASGWVIVLSLHILKSHKRISMRQWQIGLFNYRKIKLPAKKCIGLQPLQISGKRACHKKSREVQSGLQINQNVCCS